MAYRPREHHRIHAKLLLADKSDVEIAEFFDYSMCTIRYRQYQLRFMVNCSEDETRELFIQKIIESGLFNRKYTKLKENRAQYEYTH